MAEFSLTPGICSVTFRALPPEEVLRRTADAGLRAVEWGGDVHAPPADASRLRQLRAATLSHGLAVCSYGAYFRAGPHRAREEFAPALDAAIALGARRIRVWAGTLGSCDADSDAVRAVAAQSREAGRMAADHGIEIGFEFHRRTLTDSVESTLRLLDAVDMENVSTYWQPPVDATADEAIAGLERLRERVCALHVFSWWPGTNRVRLEARREMWERAFETVSAVRSMDALLEFVPGDDTALLAGESATLRSLIGAAME